MGAMNGVSWMECGEKVHGFYKELLSVGNSIMRVEDHLTMQIPGADAELETKATFSWAANGIE